MPTYAQLERESWWRAEYEPPPLKRFNANLRSTYGLTPAECGSKGDNNHLNGRHRSYNWDVNSQYCTNRGYSTTDARDRRGPRDALRATDLGLSGPPLWEVCRRVDTAVRAGELPGLAEWFGTFDGVSVVGWANGRPASSGRSHLTHGHFGYWTEAVEDAAFFDRLESVVIGDDMDATERRLLENVERILTTWAEGKDPFGVDYGDGIGRTFPNPFGLLNKRLDSLAAGGVDAGALAEALKPHLGAAVQAALLDPVVLARIAKAVNDDDHQRSAS